MTTNPISGDGESGGGGAYLGEIAQYVQALKDHDWSHDYSDEHAVWIRGRNSLARITRMQKLVDPDAVLWNVTAPPAYRLHVVEVSNG
jgi:hypothetical protein